MKFSLYSIKIVIFGSQTEIWTYQVSIRIYSIAVEIK